ncbi:hypothetical protein [Tsukamurella pseudospumae]|uniref:Uncharacterized protein n=1 Tax=Tsukamurella pseudospumae TaxID=239498 RepID=A0A138AE57_9ACTN|nr:hypothetical protein [Tsukamurella pseudospumae]KXP08791.1 hypothetical protein AXK60_08995 [Tsukamurella pseudospumae]
MSNLNRCNGCRRRLHSNIEGWNAQFCNGRIAWILCPACQTPGENAEAEVNEATLDYGTGPLGEQIARPKTGRW